MMLMACDENELVELESNDRSGLVSFTYTQVLDDCGDLGYSNVLHFNYSKGLTVFDEVNYLKMGVLFREELNKYEAVIYEFEDNPHSMWPTQSASYRVDYDFQNETIEFSDTCTYELTDLVRE